MTRQHTPKGGNEDAGDSLKGPINFFQKSPTLSFQWLFNRHSAPDFAIFSA
ncbi:hypothetical protein N5D88_09945 [Aeromonas caviae]|uniref:hypothetical protein n=1 Tax=Aeromonas caviae TaxID=648 RepID=UPI00244B99EA|nr:hypothetical protein [Aeromonas caviae]MDH1840749.1 hypothetical protein [Aeromonas caviae]